jgi:hypothetical protein
MIINSSNKKESALTSEEMITFRELLGKIEQQPKAYSDTDRIKR